MKLPFQDATFDVVLNYGAVNGMSDPRAALAEMDSPRTIKRKLERANRRGELFERLREIVGSAMCLPTLFAHYCPNTPSQP
jgi:hypothetical protein